MHHDLVEAKRWISERRFLHALNYCMVLPGPEAQQLATYIGWLLHRTWGGVVAGALFVLPSLAVLIALSWLYMAYGDVPAVAGILYGIKPAVVAIVLHAHGGSARARSGTRCSGRSRRSRSSPFSRCTCRSCDRAGGRRARRDRRPHRTACVRAGRPQGATSSASPAVIDDDTPTPATRSFAGGACARRRRVGRAVAVPPRDAGRDVRARRDAAADGMVLHQGGAADLRRRVRRAALRLPGRGRTYAWLTPTQMIDGLALGESTPGPLIMVVAFVGFVGGWTRQLFGPESQALAGGRRLRRHVLHVSAEFMFTSPADRSSNRRTAGSSSRPR